MGFNSRTRNKPLTDVRPSSRNIVEDPSRPAGRCVGACCRVADMGSWGSCHGSAGTSSLGSRGISNDGNILLGLYNLVAILSRSFSIRIILGQEIRQAVQGPIDAAI